MPLSPRYQTLTELEPTFGPLVDQYGEVDPFEWHDGGRTGDSNFAAMALHITALWRSLAPVDQLSDPKEREFARQNTDLESSNR